MKLERLEEGGCCETSRRIESGYDFPASGALPDLRQAADRQVPQALPRQGPDRFGFAINDTSGKARQHKFHRALEIYWEIEKGHGCPERRAQTAGWSVSIEDDEEAQTSSTSTARRLGC
jgi:hypothetical protein